MAVALYSCLRATGLFASVRSSTQGKGAILSRSAMSATRFAPRCRAWRRGSGTRLDRDFSPFSSMRSSLRLMRGRSDPKSTSRILFLSRTSSRTCVKFSRPSILLMSFPCKKRTLRPKSGRFLHAERPWISLNPSWSTSKEDNVCSPTGVALGSNFSGPRCSTRLWFNRSTAKAVKPLKPDRSEIMLLSKFKTLKLEKNSPDMQFAVSRILWEDKSSSLTCSKNLWPNFSTMNSSVSLPLYVSLAAACSPLSTPNPSRTFSFLRWKIVYKRYSWRWQA
mmetsp:Transcript_21006/g.32923  ORF Transcript_21006/g.32923 Transcript_21006/m.32923 type:complete len:278 (-) Transcript_21006:26-859(-)